MTFIYLSECTNENSNLRESGLSFNDKFVLLKV